MFIFYVISKIHGFGNYSTGSSVEFNSTLKMRERFREINYISIEDGKLQKKIKYKALNSYLFFKDVYGCSIVEMQIFITLTCVTQLFFFCTQYFLFIIDYWPFLQKTIKEWNWRGRKAEFPNRYTKAQSFATIPWPCLLSRNYPQSQKSVWMKTTGMKLPFF